MLTKQEVLQSIDKAYRELESQKYALDQSAIVAITDVRGDIVYVNEKFCKISQYSEQELLGHNHRIINSGYHSKEFFVDMWNTISSGKIWKNDIKNKAKDGSYYWVATTITPFLDENNKPYMYCSIRFDITRQKELEAELEKKLKERSRMLQELSDQNKQLEDFCYIISHNLRAPLSNLVILSQMIKSTSSIDDKLLYLDKINPTVNSLRETFDELVDATETRLQASVPVDHIILSETAEKIRKGFIGEIIKLKAALTFDFSAVNEIRYPRKYIDSIFSNLISNALKYHDPKRSPKITIRSYLNENCIFLEVKDNGLGIDLIKYGNYIFKLRKTFHAHPEAKGVGLFMTKTQVEAMKGKIWVESTPGEGTTFTIQLCEVDNKKVD